MKFRWEFSTFTFRHNQRKNNRMCPTMNLNFVSQVTFISNPLCDDFTKIPGGAENVANISALGLVIRFLTTYFKTIGTFKWLKVRLQEHLKQN